jgi:hypothetical protein
VSLVILAGGVGVAVWEGSDSKSTFYGIVLCLTGEPTIRACIHLSSPLFAPPDMIVIAGTICNGLMMSTSGRLMSEKIDVLRLTFYTAPISCFILIPFYVQVCSSTCQ